MFFILKKKFEFCSVVEILNILSSITYLLCNIFQYYIKITIGFIYIVNIFRNIYKTTTTTTTSTTKLNSLKVKNTNYKFKFKTC